MGLRERLETIKSSNLSSYDEFSLDTVIDPKRIQQRIGNPWLTIWLRPRTTIRAIVESDPGYRVVSIALLVGLSKALIRASSRHFGDRLPFAAVLGFCIVLGPLLMLISLWLGAAILQRTGKLLGGHATSGEVRAAIVWGSVPYIVVLALWIPALFLIGSEIFESFPGRVMTEPLPRLALFLMYLDDLIMLIWGMVLTLCCLVEVFQMSVWRVLLAIVLMVPLFIAILIGPVMLAMIAIGIIMTAPPPTPQAMPPVRLPLVGFRKSGPPSLLDGPVVRAIWNSGYGVSVQTKTRPPNQTVVVGLEVRDDVQSQINDDVLGHLRELPDLEKLTLAFAAGVTNTDLKHLRGLKNLQQLEILSGSITDEGLENLSGLTQLRELVLEDCDQLEGPGLVHLQAIAALRKLSLKGSQVHGLELSRLRTLPFLTDLNLADSGTTDDDLRHLSGLKYLKNLNLSESNPIHGSGLVHLKVLKNLQSLKLNHDPVNDHAVETLIQLKQLLSLDVSGCRLSPSGLKRLRQSLPTTRIDPPEVSPEPDEQD